MEKNIGKTKISLNRGELKAYNDVSALMLRKYRIGSFFLVLLVLRGSFGADAKVKLQIQLRVHMTEAGLE